MGNLCEKVRYVYCKIWIKLIFWCLVEYICVFYGFVFCVICDVIILIGLIVVYSIDFFVWWLVLDIDEIFM